MAALLHAILLPKAIAVCKCEAHTNSSDPVSAGNVKADADACSVAKQGVLSTIKAAMFDPMLSLTLRLGSTLSDGLTFLARNKTLKGLLVLLDLFQILTT